MKKSKIILLSKIVIVLALIFYIIYIFKNKDNLSKYRDETEFKGYIQNITKKGDKTTITLKAKENILVKTYADIDLKIGDYVLVNGSLVKPSENRNFHLFNYRNYLLTKKIYYIVRANDIKKIKSNQNIFYQIKQKIIDRIDKIPNSNYLKAFILGDSSNIDDDSLDSFRQNGISHLLAISGMHVSILTMILLKILNKLNKHEKINEIIVMLFLCFYMFITSFSVSIIRATLMFIISKLFKKITTKKVFLTTLIITLFINPFYILSISFQFSYIVSFYLIFLGNNKKGYIKQLFSTSLIAFLASLPIQINNFFSINFLSVFLNLLFVPLFSCVLFPLTLVTFIFPFFTKIFLFLVTVFENLSKICSEITFLKFSFSYMPIYICLIYYILITVMLYYKKKILVLIFIVTLFIHYNINYFINYSSITMVDVGQGDSILISLKNNKGNILIDTGGVVNSSYSISSNTIIPYLKSVGIKSLDYLILTHGDYDHSGEAINLINNFKVKNVLLNSGNDNELEEKIISLLNSKRIKYMKINEKTLNIKNYPFYFINTKNSNDENEDSLVFLTKIDGKKILFTGDANKLNEKSIIGAYDIGKLDILKVGHHGSKTSSSLELLEKTNPTYALISAGVNNKFKHPSEETITNLNRINSNILVTKDVGMIKIKLKDILEVKTCLHAMH